MRSLRTPLGTSEPLEISQSTWDLGDRHLEIPFKPLEVPKEIELSDAFRVLRNKEFEAVQCVLRGFNRF